MKIEKQIKKAFAMLSRVGETDEAADCARTICRESRALASLPPSLRAFFKTNDCCALLNSLEEVLPDGALPVYADFLSQWQGGLSIRQAANFRMTLLLFLLLKASAAAEKKDTAALKEITRSFFTCKDYCFPELTEKLCDAARILSGEQAGVYANMADETRAEYLRVLALEAKKQGVSEKLLAEKIVQKANREGKHCGFFLPLRKERKKEGIARIVCAYLLSMAVCLSLGIFLQSAAAGLLLFLPVLKLVWSLTSRAAAASGKARLTGLFVGSHFYANAHAVEWFARNVAPQLKDTEIEVVGKGFEAERRYSDTVELSMGQYIEDVRLVVEGRKPVRFYNRTGGNIMAPEDIVEFVEKEA